jgi:non-heme chloroperoxidase
METQSRTLNVSGAELTSVEQGTGDPVVFVHGSLGDYRNWGFQTEPFSQRYRMIACSRRRHWPNAWPEDNRECAVATHAADLAALIEALGVGPAHLVGNSYGAMTVLDMAARRPELVRTMVLGEPPLLPWLAESSDDSLLFTDFLTNAWNPAGLEFRQGDSEAGVRLFIDGVLGEGGFDRLPAPAKARMMDNAPSFGIELKSPPETYYSSLTHDDVKLIQIPTLLVTGEVSPRMFHRVIEQLAHTLPAAERAEIANTSHAMYAGNPDAFNETVLAFLARH